MLWLKNSMMQDIIFVPGTNIEKLNALSKYYPDRLTFVQCNLSEKIKYKTWWIS